MGESMNVCSIYSNGAEVKHSHEIVGCVEYVRNNAIVGWVLSMSGATIDLHVQVNGEEFLCEVERFERPDIAEKYGNGARMCGFSLIPLDADCEVVEAMHEGAGCVEVVGNGVSLQWAFEEALFQDVDDGSKEVCTRSLLRSYLDSVNEFSIAGWGVRNDGSPCDISVVVNGTKIDCPVVRMDRNDVSRSLGLQTKDAGFKVILPGYMWELKDADGVCRVEVYADGQPVTNQTILLKADEVVKWVAGVLESGDVNDEVLSLLAVEHVKYCGVYHELGDGVRDGLLEVATRNQLADFLMEERGNNYFKDAPDERIETIVLRSAMRELNDLLANHNGEIYPLIKNVYKKHGLRGVAKEWYLNLAVQMTCASGEFERLWELTDFKYLYEFESSKKPHQLALLLPVLVCSGDVSRAAMAMRMIAKHLNKSWLPCECLSYSLRYVRSLEVERSIDIREAEEFRSAFVCVLDGFKGEWFSRLHDNELVSSMAFIVSESELYTDYHKREMVVAAIRHYGLSPVFWQDELLPLPSHVNSEFERAEKAWMTVKNIFKCKTLSISVDVMTAFDALDYFSGRGNVEAMTFMRELVLKLLADSDSVQADILSRITKKMTSPGAQDVLRIAAYPISDSYKESVNADLNAMDVHGSLRDMAGYRKSAVYDMQRNASHYLRYMYESMVCEKNDGSSLIVDECLKELQRKCGLLGTWQGMFLGADLLISGYLIASLHGVKPTSVLMNAGEMIRRGLLESKREMCIPAPICSVVGRMVSIENDHNLKCFANEVRTLITEKYGAKYDELLTKVFDYGCGENALGWPEDTMVVIDVFGGDGDSKIKSVRDTWIKELSSRHIPYVFVVGGESESLDGDILTLGVGEGCESRAQKTLKTIGWVVANTNAQYVVKIDVECYLDVERFFSALSYRKYHYYGRIVNAGHGGLNRTWHCDLSTSEYAAKSIDKSPANSAFASGSVAYSLSRFAMQNLLEVANNNRGKQLIAVSFSEDKLVGDLLAIKNIHPCDEDFDAYIGDSCGSGIVVGGERYSAFYPGISSPAVVSRCTREVSLKDVDEYKCSNELWPKKIWPTFLKPSIKQNHNQLELLTDKDVLKQLLQHELVVVSVVRNEMVLLPQFLNHYRDMGVKCFIFVDNCSDDGTREFLVSQTDAIVYASDTEYKHSHYGVSWQQAVLGNHCVGKWVLLADADEFLVYENSESVPLTGFVEDIESAGDDGVLIYMIDMYPYGDLDDASFEKGNVFDVAKYFDKDALIELRFGGGMYSNSRNFVNGLRHRLAPSRINAYVSQKYALFKYQPWIRLSEGVHYTANMTVSKTHAFFAHFKYHAGFKEKVELEVRRKQHFNGAEEYHKYASMIAELSGGFGVVGVSEKYVDSNSFVRIAKRIN